MRRLGSALLAALTLTLAFTATAQADIRLNPVRSLEALEGELAPRDRIVTFDDAGACSRNAYVVTIRWGDGSESAGTVTVSDQVLDADLGQMRCNYAAIGMHTYTVPGSYALSARVCRGTECQESGAGGTATVAGARIDGDASSLRLNAGQAFAGELAKFRDENRSSRASDFTTVIDWGDGTTSPGTIAGDEGRFDVSGSHTYGAAGTYPLSVRLLERGTVVAVATAAAEVAGGAGPQAVLAGTATAFRAVAGTPFNRSVAAFADPAPIASLAGYQATVDWGDGTVSAGNVGAGLAVAGGHTYARVGSYAVRVTLQRPGATGTVASTATVTSGARPTMRLRGGRTLSRRALRRGVPVRVSVPASVRSLRVAVVRVGSRVRTLGTVRVGVRGTQSAGVRRANVRVRLSSGLVRRMRSGSYALQFRVAGSGLIRTQFRVR